jgi:hypothetical protein
MAKIKFTCSGGVRFYADETAWINVVPDIVAMVPASSVGIDDVIIHNDKLVHVIDCELIERIRTDEPHRLRRRLRRTAP